MSRLGTLLSRRTLAYAAGGSVVAAGVSYLALDPKREVFPPPPPGGRAPPPWSPPSRAQMLQSLKSSAPIRTIAEDAMLSGAEEFDLLVIGGGATGSGVAVDAATRGLKVAMVEREDFSSGTSSKSTKLVHGGVRYLQKAVLELDYEQYKLVKEALHERKIFLQTAPYLSHMLPIMLPIYKWWQLPYYWAGCKAYDFLAGGENMESSYIMTKGRALEAFPMLKSDGLVGAIVYYDGQHNDSRMNISLVMTAVQAGATVANYTEVIALHKRSENGKLCGARLRDVLTGDEWDVRAKGIINATGPFSDTLLLMDSSADREPSKESARSFSFPIKTCFPERRPDKLFRPLVAPSSGIHITLPNYYSPRTMGLLDPATSDGRVIFFLPWQGNTIAGTTDTAEPGLKTDDLSGEVSGAVDREPVPREEEIAWILDEVRRYLSPDIKVRRGDVLSAWSGLRPLIRDPHSPNSKDLVRNHLIYVSEGSSMVTISGGKWTTYRAMAAETVDKANEVYGFGAGPSITERVRLVGSDNWSRNMFIGLVQRFGLETEVAKHLAENYGDRAWAVASLAERSGKRWPLHGIRLNPNYPYTEAEVRYATRSEYAQTAVDFLARRSRLSFLNATAALDALPRVIEIMGSELHWSPARKKQEFARGRQFLVSMGLPEPGKLPEDSGAQSRLNWTEHLGNLIAPILPFTTRSRNKGDRTWTSRAHFNLQELDDLKEAFIDKAGGSDDGKDLEADTRISLDDVLSLVRDTFHYASSSTTEHDLLRALTSVGIRETKSNGGRYTFDEFVDVAANFKEASPIHDRHKTARRTVPVEKSGGGV